jgi:hypothetical protein
MKIRQIKKTVSFAALTLVIPLTFLLLKNRNTYQQEFTSEKVNYNIETPLVSLKKMPSFESFATNSPLVFIKKNNRTSYERIEATQEDNDAYYYDIIYGEEEPLEDLPDLFNASDSFENMTDEEYYNPIWDDETPETLWD